MVDGTVPGSPSAISRIVLRRILPERVLGSAATTSTRRRATTAPISARTRATSSSASDCGRAGVPLLDHDQRPRHLALQLVGDPDHRALGDGRVRRQDGLDRPGGQPVSGDVDHVVGPAHHEDVAVVVDVAAVPGQVVPGVGTQIAVDEALVVAPDGGQGARAAAAA